MRGTFFGIEIGRTGLSTAQFGLDTTGHNIANTDTSGYTRQRIVQTAYDPFSSIGRFAPIPGHSLVGGGTRIKILDQIRSAYLDRRFRTESTQHEYWNTRTERLSYMESFFDSVNEKTSINYTMAEFFRAMEILSEDPISGAPRTLMQTTAMDLVQQLNMIYSGLMDLQESENRAVKTKVDVINQMTEDIVVLNTAIYNFEATGLIANDLRDKRNLLVDQLAQLIDIEYEEYPDPDNPRFDCFRIFVDGRKIVDHDSRRQIDVWPKENPLPGEPDVWEVCWVARFDEVTGLPVQGPALDFDKMLGGQIKAHLDVRDNLGIKNGTLDTDSRSRGIPYYIEMVNDLARALVQEINNVHMQGWTDHPLGSQSGVLFFHEEPEWSSWVNYDRYADPLPANAAQYRYNAGTQRWEQWVYTPGAGVPEGWTSTTAISEINGSYYYTDSGNDYRWNGTVWEEWDMSAGTATGGPDLATTPDLVNGGDVFPDGNTYRFDTLTGQWQVFDNTPTDWSPAAGGNYIAQDTDTGEYLLYDGVTGDVIGSPFDDTYGLQRVVDSSKISAKDIKLSEDITDTAFNIACSSMFIDRAASGGPEMTQRHNNENIKAIYELFRRSDIVVNREIDDGAGGKVLRRFDIGSFDDYGTVIRFDLGKTLHTSKQTTETCRLLTLAAENQRTAIAGVSLDEEMVGIVKYQHAYNGASRVITAMDEALDRLINGTGRVGL